MVLTILSDRTHQVCCDWFRIMFLYQSEYANAIFIPLGELHFGFFSPPGVCQYKPLKICSMNSDWIFTRGVWNRQVSHWRFTKKKQVWYVGDRRKLMKFDCHLVHSECFDPIFDIHLAVCTLHNVYEAFDPILSGTVIHVGRIRVGYDVWWTW